MANVAGTSSADTITEVFTSIGVVGIPGVDSDIINAGDGDDFISGGAGNDTINGGTGIDTAAYTLATAAVTVNLTSGTAAGGAGSDVLLSIENIVGSSFADTITGNAANNNLRGGQGDDRLDGGTGNDIIDGGTGIDTAAFTSAIGAVTVNLTSGTAVGGAGSDVLLSIENVVGSSFADTITGNANNNTLRGGAGSDLLAGAGGNDIFDYSTLSDSLLANYDIITDYSLGDILDRPGSSSTLLNLSIGIAAGLSAAQVGSILNPFSFTSSSSVAFTSIGFSGTFIAFNDAIAGFNSATDAIVHLINYNINNTNFATIA